jgi:hypothetical protein
MNELDCTHRRRTTKVTKTRNWRFRCELGQDPSSEGNCPDYDDFSSSPWPLILLQDTSSGIERATKKEPPRSVWFARRCRSSFVHSLESGQRQSKEFTEIPMDSASPSINRHGAVGVQMLCTPTLPYCGFNPQLRHNHDPNADRV